MGKIFHYISLAANIAKPLVTTPLAFIVVPAIAGALLTCLIKRIKR